MFFRNSSKRSKRCAPVRAPSSPREKAKPSTVLTASLFFLPLPARSKISCTRPHYAFLGLQNRRLRIPDFSRLRSGRVSRPAKTRQVRLELRRRRFFCNRWFPPQWRLLPRLRHRDSSGILLHFETNRYPPTHRLPPPF